MEILLLGISEVQAAFDNRSYLLRFIKKSAFMRFHIIGFQKRDRLLFRTSSFLFNKSCWLKIHQGEAVLDPEMRISSHWKSFTKSDKYRGFLDYLFWHIYGGVKRMRQKWAYLTMCNHYIITFVLASVQLRRESAWDQITHTFCENRLIRCTHLKMSLLARPKRPISDNADTAPRFVFVAPWPDNCGG